MKRVGRRRERSAGECSTASATIVSERLRALRAQAFILATAALAGCGAKILPDGATLQSGPLHDTWFTFMWSGVFVALVVYGLIAWCLIRYRKRPADREFPVQFRRNDRMEITYTVIPILMVGGLFAITYPAERHTETLLRNPPLVVNVTGFRWSWRFDYPRSGTSVVGTADSPPEMVLPVDTTTRFNVSSVDVDHAFWVPDFLFKRDALPGVENVFEWTPVKIGTFRGECGEYCGLDHTMMSFTVRVVDRPTFERWLHSRPRGAAPTGAER